MLRRQWPQIIVQFVIDGDKCVMITRKPEIATILVLPVVFTYNSLVGRSTDIMFLHLLIPDYVFWKHRLTKLNVVYIKTQLVIKLPLFYKNMRTLHCEHKCVDSAWMDSSSCLVNILIYLQWAACHFSTNTSLSINKKVLKVALESNVPALFLCCNLMVN